MLLTIIAMFVLMPLSVSSGRAGEPIQPNQANESGLEITASVSGRVVINGTAAPAGIKIALVDSPVYSNKVFATSETDSGGYYIFRNLKPGEYWVKAETGHDYVGRSGSDSGLSAKAFVYRAGTLEHVDLDLISSGIIAGRIVGADGRGVPHLQIYLDAPAGRGRLYPPLIVTSFAQVDPEVVRVNNLWRSLGNIVTDEEGFYEIRGLTAGRYLVSVGEDLANVRGEVTLHGGLAEGNSGRVGTDPYYPMTFYPGGHDITRAQVVELTEGERVGGINIKLGPAFHSRSLTGRTVDALTGNPIPNCVVRIKHIGPEGRVGDGIEIVGSGDDRSDAQGNFSIDRLIPGKFLLSASAADKSDLYGDGVSVVVGDSDVNGVEIKFVRGRTLTGSFVVEGEPSPEALRELGQLGFSAWDSLLSVVRKATVASDGTFRIVGLPPGKVRFSLDTFGNSDLYPFSIRRIEHPLSNRDDSLDLGANDITGVRVVLKYAVARIRGKVRITGPELPPGLKLDVSYYCRLNGGGDQASGGPVGPDGSFEFTGLPAGECRVTLSYGDEARKRAAPDQVVSVSPSGTADVFFTVDSSAIQNRK